MAKQKIMFEINADNRKAINAFGRFKRSAMGAITSVAGTFGLALGAGALIAFGKRLIETGDKIGKMAKRFGMGTDAIQKFQYMAEISGSSVDQVAKGIKTLNSAVNDASSGLKTYQRYFEELNIDYKALQKLAPEKQFDVVAQSIGKLEDKQKKLYLATKLFGRAGMELIPMLNEYNTLAKQAEDNVVFTPEDVKAAEAYNDSMNRIGKSLQRVVVDSGFLPWLADVADRLDQSIKLSKQIEKARAGGATGLATESGFQFASAALAFTGMNVGEEMASMRAGGAAEMISVKAADYQKVATEGLTADQIKTAIQQAISNKRYTP